jgi:hypothetical protein
MSVIDVVFGWALGLMGGPVARMIDRGRQRAEFAAACQRELTHFRLTMAVATYQLADHCLGMTEDLRNKLLPVVKAGDYTDADTPGLKSLTATLAQPVSTLLALAAAGKRPGISVRLMKYDLPFLDSQMQRLDILPLEIQERLLRVRSQLRNFNEAVDRVNQLLDRTFDGSLTPANHALIVKEMDASYPRVLRLAEGIVVGCTELLAILPQAAASLTVGRFKRFRGSK